jgi:CheY-like chemotaxis protein
MEIEMSHVLYPVRPVPSELGSLDRRVILLVEDDIDQLEMERAVLEQEGCLVFACQSGLFAIHTLMNEQITPDVIVLDQSMPAMDGDQFIATIRRVLRMKSVPTVLVSGTEPSEYLTPRIHSFIPKPFGRDLFLQHVQKALIPRIPSAPVSVMSLS